MNRKNTTVAVIVSVVVVGLFVAFGFFGTRGTASTPAPQTDSQRILDELSNTGTVSELRIVDVVKGTGDEVHSGDAAVVQYTGVLPDGTVFDSSLNRGQPFVFEVGAGQVIPGWDQGILGMKVGGRRVLAIPPSLAYGAQAVGSIPANSTLIFEIQLMQVVPASELSHQ